MKGDVMRSATSTRPWGRYTIIDHGTGYQVKRIEVLPGQRLSYQRHVHRAEHWTIVDGDGYVVLDGDRFDVRPGSRVHVERGMAHRIANPGPLPLTFIEVQLGSYLGEDDIVRLDDDYGRRSDTPAATAGTGA
ncbi:phosphomannose isomerase type II C-terminal cupin domain [Egicoccus sp. AB-alg2]|uniref:phosphomannose isomerase type II C-terminal cupin domain n=1 Tax=Egicoccus sp. AB-alg2 TaxID=3242693 RepID=UPI00359EC6AF